MAVAVVHRAGDQQHVRVLGVARVDHAKALHIVEGRETGQHLNVTAVAGTAVKVHDPRRLEPAPLDHFIDKSHFPASLRNVQPQKVYQGQPHAEQ